MILSIFRKIFLIALLVNGPSCSNKSVNNKNSNADGTQSSISDISQKFDQPKALSPEDKPNTPNTTYLPLMIVPGGGGEALAAIALVGTITGISKVFKKDEKKTDLSGSCYYGDPESPAQSPCINVTVNLLNKENEISASSSTNRQGQFRFYMPVGQSYFIQVIDRKGRTASTQTMLGRAEYVALYLKP